ncbi:SMI1/KNR4 family protein [Leptolyngbya sp. GGD]|uniref:SMI1/KNR4 family protein n=1 Tax=Leptolyngbya sp. GGD TaxID=2997907 RepID=UPI00227BDB7D|nr:SMI1/KNR4 family protein [Leptolyngbya sp. GGD]MCY6490242.1 SMI1/KNR4 family protein [Leptolyngbya sp. GGD]
MQSKAEFQQYEPCTEEEIEQIEHFLGLPLPAAYREFLLWSGKQCYFMDEMGLPFYSSEKTDLRKIALEILEMNEATDILPDDAIIISIFDETAAFAFIRTSEGDNPPVHYFGGMRANGESVIKWNWAASIEELCIERMEDIVAQVYFTNNPPKLVE